MPRKREAPSRPALFDKEALASFVAAHGCQDPTYSARVVLRVAVHALRRLNDAGATVSDRIAAWVEATRKGLQARKDVPNTLADEVAKGIAFATTRLVKCDDSEDGETSKLLLETHDGHRVEAVVIRRHHKFTSVCVSSQVGCQMGCQFCATGTMGIIGDLTAAEILEQVREFVCMKRNFRRR